MREEKKSYGDIIDRDIPLLPRTNVNTISNYTRGSGRRTLYLLFRGIVVAEFLFSRTHV